MDDESKETAEEIFTNQPCDAAGEYMCLAFAFEGRSTHGTLWVRTALVRGMMVIGSSFGDEDSTFDRCADPCRVQPVACAPE